MTDNPPPIQENTTAQNGKFPQVWVRWLQEINNRLSALEGSVSTTAFGETSVARNTAYIQAAPVYNLLPANFRTFSAGTGSAGVESRMFYAKTSTGVGDYGAIQSFRSLNYKAGQGGLARFTAMFEANVASSWQGAGLLNLGDELSFGYSGTTFGIWHRYGGVAEVRTLTVTGAAGGSENLTLTLNSTGYTIPLTTGTVQHNAYEIATWLNDNQSVWVADQLDDTVIISAQSDGAKSGTYSFSSATATGTIAQTTAGVTKTSTHIPQASWNQDKKSGLDPSKLNVYQIKFQYLGAGDIKFYVENPSTGDFDLVHTIKYANSSTRPSLDNPSMRVGLYCVSLGSTTALTVRSASVGAFVEGEVEQTRNPRAFSNTQSVGSGAETAVLVLRNRRTYNGYYNQVEIKPLDVTVANEGSKNIIVRVRSSVDFGVEKNFQTTGNNLVADVDTTSNTITTGTLLASKTVAAGGQLSINLEDLGVSLPPSLKLVVTAEKASGAAADVTATVTWLEDL